MTAQVPASTGDERDLRLDLVRGLALLFTFIDHVPNNVLSWLTLRNYGFSDASEIFVFVSGYTCMVAYGGALPRDGWPSTWVRAIRRGFEIYGAFLLLIVAYCAIVWLMGQTRQQIDETNTGVFFQSPGGALAHAMVLLYAPVNTDILPTFVLLHCAFPCLLWAMSKNTAATLTASILIYLGVQLFDWHVPTWPKGELYFNPLAWQLLFVIGAWCATATTGSLRGIIRSKSILAIVLAYLILGLLLALTWHIKPLETFVPETIGRLIYPIDKSHLSPLRVAHFLALALLVARFVPFDWRALSMPFVTTIVRCGENALPIYCISVLLSFLGSVVISGFSDAVGVQIAISIVGIALLMAIAIAMTWTRIRDQSSPRLF